MAKVHAKAAAASAAARPSLLGLLGSSGFTTALAGCCPELMAMSPEQRLAWFDAEHKAIEMVHNFGNGDAVLTGDESVLVGANSSYFHNLWEDTLLMSELPKTTPPGPPQPPMPNLDVNCSALHALYACENSTSAVRRSSMGLQPACKWITAERRCVNLTAADSAARRMRQTTDVVEVGLYGFPPFSNSSAASYEAPTGSLTFTEAVDRPIYTAYNHRKVDIGNPMFGHVCAVFAPNYVLNMTLIAPADTGAWDPSCNASSEQRQNHNNPGGKEECATMLNQSSCNVGDDVTSQGTHHPPTKCDWRHGKCVDTVVDRQLCEHQSSETECGAASGAPPPAYDGGQLTVSLYWELILHNGGCSWLDAEKQSHMAAATTTAQGQGKKSCVPFECGHITNTSKCNSTESWQLNVAHHCTWDATANEQEQGHGKCIAITPDLYCNGTGRPKPQTPPPPGLLPAEVCARAIDGQVNSQFNLCRWRPAVEATARGSVGNKSNTSTHTGRCVANRCKTLRTESQCAVMTAREPKARVVSCVWDTATSTCAEYDGNCSMLPDATTCVAASTKHGNASSNDCVWGATNTSSGRDVCHLAPNGTRPPVPNGGISNFNCSAAIWPGYALGTPFHYYHILNAGVRSWLDGTSPATQLGVLFRRMADPTHTPIVGSEIFKYWEAMIAGNPHYPEVSAARSFSVSCGAN